MKVNFKPLALALALGVIGAGPAQAGSYNSKRATNHTHSASASVSVPALLVFGRALSRIAADPAAPNHEWAVRASAALTTQVGWNYPPFAPDSGWKPWAASKAKDALFANLWLSSAAKGLIRHTYQSPDSVLDEATRLLEHSPSAQLQQLWTLASQHVDAAVAKGDIVAVSDASNVHFRLGDATYLGGQGGWSIVHQGGIVFGSASGGQERIGGNTYSLEVRNGDELSHGTDKSQAVFGGN